MTDQAKARRTTESHCDDGDGLNIGGPITAPGGWSSLLTWRKPKTMKAQAPKLDSILRTPPPTRTPLPHEYSPTVEHQRTSSSRSRAPIPFDLGPRRTASSSSTSSNTSLYKRASTSSLVITDAREGEDDEEDRVQDLNTAFATLARVKDKNDGAYATIRSTRITSSSSTRRPSLNMTTPPTSPNPAPPGGWLAWGTSRIRSTLPRGMASALFYPEFDGSEEASKNDVGSVTFSSPVTSSNVPSTISSEKWKPTESDEIDRHVERMVSFAGVDGHSRSIVTLSAPSLPPWEQVSHDIILQRILTKTLPLVENPGGYTLILFASGADQIDGSEGSKTIWPGWTWCWKAWRNLDRRWVYADGRN